MPAMLGSILIASIAILGSGCTPRQKPRTYGPPLLSCSVEAYGLKESSGVAASNQFLGWYYTHNDDDKPMRYWKFRLTGEVHGPYVMPNITNRDIEDMASRRVDGINYLYFADIGDNQLQYDFVRVIRCVEPTAARGEQRRVDIYTFTYPDGPHNAEAFFVHPKTGDFWIIEKTQKGAAGVYRARNPRPGSGKLERVGEVSIPVAMKTATLITGGDVSPDGKFVVLRTYFAAFEFPAEDFDNWFKNKPLNIKINLEVQGEAICYSSDGERLLTTSEGSPCPVSTIPLQRQP